MVTKDPAPALYSVYGILLLFFFFCADSTQVFKVPLLVIAQTEAILLVDYSAEDEIFKRYLALTSVDEANGWCGGSLLGDQDESSEIYKHYAELCQGLDMNPFEKHHEIEQHYGHALQMGMIVNVDDAAVEAEMEAAFKDFDKIDSDLGIFPRCKSLTGDPSQLTRWIIGEEKIGRT
ncbi:hypothetical protein Droror1_Dr00011612 [Drosera rotundifolia]